MGIAPFYLQELPLLPILKQFISLVGLGKERGFLHRRRMKYRFSQTAQTEIKNKDC